MFDKSTYISRREKLKKQVGSGLILLLGNEQSSMNYKDNFYHFRQDSNFLYFFGLDRPGLTGVLDIDNNWDILFGNISSMDEIIWTGPQPTLEEEADTTGISIVRDVNILGAFIEAARKKGQTIHYLPPYRMENSFKLVDWLEEIPEVCLKEESSVTLIKAIIAQRSYKTREEIREIEAAVEITSAMHLAAIKGAREGMTETQLAGVVNGIAISSGGNLSFPTILTVNGQVLHNHYSSNIMKAGQMVLCDSGAENAMHYAGDMTRTFPVSGKFTSLQKELYEVVAAAQQAAIDALKPGKLFLDVHLLACEKLVEGLKGVGLMKGDSKEAVQAGAHTLFFQCGLGHMMGLDVHDMEDLGEEYVGYTPDLKKSKEFGLKSLRLGRALEAGFVVTVEPGLYFIPQLMEVYKKAKKLDAFINYDKIEDFYSFGGIRIEDDLLITPTGSQLLGNPLVKSVQGIEELRGLA
ncbi:aminopeptidase P family protein [Flavitalea flava]